MDNNQHKPEDYVRINGDNIEIFITGLSVSFTSLVRSNLIKNFKDRLTDRTSWICKTILDNVSQQDLHDKPVILDCRMDNFFINYLAKNVIDELCLQNVKVLTSTYPKDVLNGYEYEVDLLAYTDWCYFYTNVVNEGIDWKNIEIDIPVMSLSGRATESRARFTKDLLDICGEKARISFGISTHYKASIELQKKFEKIMYPYPVPFRQHTDTKLLVDVAGSQSNTGPNLYQSLVSIVNETNDFSIEHIHLSEKTFKFFAWHQIPIFNASPKQAETVRSLGFDLFDDIIDHSYDTAPNEHLHRLKLLNSISKFLRDYPTIEDVNNLRKEIFPRLEANNKLLMKLNHQRKFKSWPRFN